MFSRATTLPSAPEKLWVLVANRTCAYFFEQVAGQDLKLIQTKEFPEGRLKNREIDTDRNSGGVSPAGTAYPVHGLVNKGEAHFHETQVFARQLADSLEKARSQNHYDGLVIIAEDRFLGELQASLNDSTKKYLTNTIHKDVAGLETRPLIEEVKRLLS